MIGMPQPAFYVFKCQQSAPPGMPKPSCVTQSNPESQQLMQHLSQSLMMKGIIATVSPIQTSCLNRCQQGPVILVEPGHTMYVGLTKEKIDRIVEEHFVGGNVVTDYVIADELWADPIDPASMAR
jgi:(2Fe-2S) ferredoxin